MDKDKKFVLTPARRLEIIGILRKEILYLAKKRKDEIQRMASYASLCVDDAFSGRLHNGHASTSLKAPWIYRLFCIQTHPVLFQLVLFSCFIHSMAIFYEPEQGCSSSAMYRYVQLLILLIYAFDVAMKMTYQGFKVR